MSLWCDCRQVPLPSAEAAASAEKATYKDCMVRPQGWGRMISRLDEENATRADVFAFIVDYLKISFSLPLLEFFFALLLGTERGGSLMIFSSVSRMF